MVGCVGSPASLSAGLSCSILLSTAALMSLTTSASAFLVSEKERKTIQDGYLFKERSMGAIE